MKRAVSALVLVIAAGTAAAAVSGTWKVVASPNAGDGDRLNAVTVVSPGDAWAVGSSGINGGSTLIERWDGTGWRLVPSANGDLLPNALLDVAAVSAADVWAVGSSGGAAGPEVNTLAEHWDGSRWGVVPTPNPGFANRLGAVVAVSAGDVWAAGSYASRKTKNWHQPLVLHWDGRRWSAVSAPRIGLEASIADLAVVSASDVWAVGAYSESGGNSRTLILRWDGTAWRIVPSPNVGSVANSLSAVAAVSRTDAWAVGGSGGQTLVLHWNGTQWSVVPSPNVEGASNGLSDLTALSPTDVWAVGTSRTQSTTGGSTTFYHFQTLTMHWDGTSWAILPSPNPSVSAGCCTSSFNVLSGVAATSGDDVWAVGYYSSGNAIGTLIERYTVP